MFRDFRGESGFMGPPPLPDFFKTFPKDKLKGIKGIKIRSKRKVSLQSDRQIQCDNWLIT